MGILQRLMGRAAPQQKSASKPAAPAAGTSSVPPATSLRRELLRLALRQSLKQNGIPPQWVTAEALEVGGRAGAGIHVRLILQHWDQRLMACTMAFQDDFERRLLTIEPLARNWLRGFSWQFQLPPGTAYAPLPEPHSWGEIGPQANAPAPIGTRESEAARKRDLLERAFEEQDGRRAPSGGQPDFEATQPFKRT
jgi:hypothetical protein